MQLYNKVQLQNVIYGEQQSRNV